MTVPQRYPYHVDPDSIPSTSDENTNSAAYDILERFLTRPAWHNQAACRAPDVNPDWFYPANGGGNEAKKICAECPVRQQCLTYALENNIMHGIWGGCGERTRQKMRNSDITPAGCGTRLAYQRHLRRRETPCDLCRAANARWHGARRKRT